MCENIDNIDDDNNYNYKCVYNSLDARLICHQLRFYKYAVTCIDSYVLHDNPKRLQNFIHNLCRLDRGQIALDDYFQPLLKACTTCDLTEIKNIRDLLEKDIKKNELILTTDYSDSKQTQDEYSDSTPASACDSTTCI